MHGNYPLGGDTIAAIATPEGTGGIAIIRISGPDAERALLSCFRPHSQKRGMKSGALTYGQALDGDEVIDEAMAVLMRAPKSYTREDVAEIQCHGGRWMARRVLQSVLKCGVRLAEPGEFTRRAFENGRIDLNQAEAVMQLIGAGGEAALRAGVRQLQGGVSAFVSVLEARLTKALAGIEACTDYPEEVDEEESAQWIAREMRSIAEEIDLKASGRAARILREGASVVLTGPPNAGKSSLMNALLSAERAIVTEIPGTTRDVLTEKISLGGILAELSDTAGVRASEDPIERIGVDRALRAVESADIVLRVLDGSQDIPDEQASDQRMILVLNKADLGVSQSSRALLQSGREDVFSVSAARGDGLAALTAHLESRLQAFASADSLTAERHIQLAERASHALKRGAEAIEAGFPLDTAAIDLKEALEDLDAITGKNATEEVIDSIFANFCVGK